MRFFRFKHRSSGFTLIELMMAISIMVLIASSIYFALDTALETWVQARDRMILQKVLSETMDRIMSGLEHEFAIKDAMEAVRATETFFQFIPPWTDATHSVAGGGFVYRLNRRIKPGTSVPIGEVKLASTGEWRLVPVKVLESEQTEGSKVQLGFSGPVGNDLRFTYHPDSSRNPDVVQSIYWDRNTESVYSETSEGVENISANPFGAGISNLKFRYYDNTNQLVTKQDYVQLSQIHVVTGVEVYIEARLGNEKEALLNFVTMRNAPLKTGRLSLREGMEIPIPDSKDVHTLLLTNLSGIGSGDELRLEAEPKNGRNWVLKVEFERIGKRKPEIKKLSIEYPPSRVVYTEYPKTDASLGVDLLVLGSNGLYDYDDDQDVDDIVDLENVTLKIMRMDIDGAGIFVRP